MIHNFLQDTWLAFTLIAGIVILWSVLLVSVGGLLERRRRRAIQRRHAEALRSLSRLSREMSEEL